MEKNTSFLSNIQPFITSFDQGLIRPGTPGQERATMTARAFQQGFDTDEEFFRFHLGRHGRDRSLSSLWQLFSGTPSTPSPAAMDDFLPYRE